MEISLLTIHDSCDEFIQRLRRSGSPHKVVAAVLRRQALDKYLEVDDVCELLVSAEAVAAMRGWGDADLGLRAFGAAAPEVQDLNALTEAAFAAVQYIMDGPNELLDACPLLRRPLLVAALSELQHRLKRRPRAIKESVGGRMGRPKPGDVFRVPISENQFAYGRVCRRGYVYIYSGLWCQTEPPPIGRREFSFYTTLIARALLLIGTDSHPIVGRDPFNASGEVPLIYSERQGQCEVWGEAGPLKGYRKVLPWQCIGMETMGTDSWESVGERIRNERTSVKRSIERLSPYLDPVDVKRAINILGTQGCRRFSEEENISFDLVG